MLHKGIGAEGEVGAWDDERRLFRRVDELLCKLLSRIGEARIISASSLADRVYKGICLFFLLKAAKTHAAIGLLMDNRCVEDARALLRSLIELAINLRYISKEPEKRALLYSEYAYVVWWRRMKDAKKISSEHSLPPPEDKPEVADELRKNHEGVKANYRGRGRKPTWSGLSVKRMAEEVGMAADYFFYTWHCGQLHSGPENAASYLQMTARGLNAAPWEADPKELAGTAVETCRYSQLITETLGQVFAVEIQSDLDEIKSMLAELGDGSA